MYRYTDEIFYHQCPTIKIDAYFFWFVIGSWVLDIGTSRRLALRAFCFPEKHSATDIGALSIPRRRQLYSINVDEKLSIF